MSTWGRGSTRASRQLRARVLTQHPTCHLNYDGCTHHATEDDHVIPLSEGGTNHPDNHRGACHNCHRIKSQAEAARARARGAGKAHHPRERHPGLR